MNFENNVCFCISKSLGPYFKYHWENHKDPKSDWDKKKNTIDIDRQKTILFFINENEIYIH